MPPQRDRDGDASTRRLPSGDQELFVYPKLRKVFLALGRLTAQDQEDKRGHARSSKRWCVCWVRAPKCTKAGVAHQGRKRSAATVKPPSYSLELIACSAIQPLAYYA